MPIAILASNGRIILPLEVRAHLHLREGDRMEFSIDPVEGVRLRRVTVSAKALFGMLYQPDVKPQTLEEIDEAIGRYHAEEDSRIRRGEEEGHKG